MVGRVASGAVRVRGGCAAHGECDALGLRAGRMRERPDGGKRRAFAGGEHRKWFARLGAFWAAFCSEWCGEGIAMVRGGAGWAESVAAAEQGAGLGWGAPGRRRPPVSQSSAQVVSSSPRWAPGKVWSQCCPPWCDSRCCAHAVSVPVETRVAAAAGQAAGARRRQQMFARSVACSA